MKNRLLHLFMKRFLKYLILLCLLTAMLIPLIQVSKSYIRDIVVQNLTRNLQESTDMLEHDISKAQQMISILASEESFQKLIKDSGELPLEHYVYLSELQTSLAQLSVVFDLDTMCYLVFRNTPIFISNHGCSDDYTALMPIPAEYAGQGAQKWHELLFQSPYNHQILPYMEFLNPYSSKNSSGIVFIIDTVQNAQINSNCKLVALMDCGQIVEKVLNSVLDENSFLYIANENGQILYQYRYADEKALSGAESNGSTVIGGEHYQVFQTNSDLWGLQMVYGMSAPAIEQRIQEVMLGWFSLYLGIGLSIIIVVSLLFSIRETNSIRSLINTAAKTADFPYTKDEYSFLNNAFQTLGQSNLEKQEQIDLLSRQVETGILESLIMRGSYAAKGQPDFLRYFNGHFDFFCVIIFLFKAAGQRPNPMEQQQFYAATEEVLCSEGLQSDHYFNFLVLNSSTELVCVLSLNPSDSASLNPLHIRLLQAMKRLNDQLEQEEWAVTVCAGISKPATDITNIRTAYLQAKNALSLQDQVHSGEIYQYSAPQTAALKSTFESIKFQYCYDLLISGDKKGIADFFDDLAKGLRHRAYDDQEIMQLFFTLREPVYNAYIQIFSSENAGITDSLPTLPEYVPGYTVEQIQKDYSAFCLFLCDMVEKNRRNYNNANSRKILDYIQEHFAEPELTAIQIAEKILVSEKYLYAAVKEASGKTFGKYVESLRMKKAEALLLTTDLTNIQIFHQCGFGSENTFYRNFLKVHGMPPAVWKVKMQAETGKKEPFDSPAEIDSPQNPKNSSPKND